jgi:adenylyltransferase/sulfurtransferase
VEEYFKRQIELWGLDTQKELAKKEILIVGSGGLGSSLAFALGSIGLNKITLVDFDEVAIHNIHRQIAFSLGDEGKYKAEVVGNMIKSRSKFTDVETYIESFEDFAKRENMNFDLIFDATDNFETRQSIDSYAKSKDIPWVYGSVEGFYGQVSLFIESSFQAFQTLSTKPKGVATPIVMQVASFQANIGLKYLINEPIQSDTLYLLNFSSDGIFEVKHFKMPK